MKKRGRRSSPEKGAATKEALTESYQHHDHAVAMELRSKVVDDNTVEDLVNSRNKQAVRASHSLEEALFKLGDGDQIAAALELFLQRPLLRILRKSEADNATLQLSVKSLRDFLRSLQPKASDGSHRGTRTLENEAAMQAILTGLCSQELKEKHGGRSVSAGLSTLVGENKLQKTVVRIRWKT